MLDYPYDDDATTDFELWLEGEAPRDLAEAVSEKLIIASDEAKWLFLQIVHQQYIVKFRRRR
jgi:hypothetical protein